MPRAWLSAPIVSLAIATLLGGAVLAAQLGPRGRLFPPEELGQLEGPDRDEWQQPERVMDALGIADGARVADIGAGGGWFTIRLARRVGPNGVVFAEDIQQPMLDAVGRRVAREGFQNVRTILGTVTDPHLEPGSVHAALMVGVFGYLPDPVQFFANIRKGLAPTGRVGIVDYKTDGFGPGPDDTRVTADAIVRAAAQAGLRLLRHETFLRYQYLLIFSPAAPAEPRS